MVALVILVDRRFKLGHGRAFFLYVAGYTAGRAWIENLRIDTVNHFLGLRLNVWTAIILFVLAVVAFIISARKTPARKTSPPAPPPASPPPTRRQPETEGRSAESEDAAKSEADELG